MALNNSVEAFLEEAARVPLWLEWEDEEYFHTETPQSDCCSLQPLGQRIFQVFYTDTRDLVHLCIVGSQYGWAWILKWRNHTVMVPSEVLPLLTSGARLREFIQTGVVLM